MRYSTPVWRLRRWSVLRIMALLGATIGLTTPVAEAATGDWPMYLADLGHSGFNRAETRITPTTAPHLKLKWTHQGGTRISTQPVEANNRVYWGSFDGYEHATTLSGAPVWATFLGTTTLAGCPMVGVASTGTVLTVVRNGTATSVLFVGGGDAQFYALNALTGTILWRTRLGSLPNSFIWSSPTVYNGSVYIGLSASGDCPVTPGQVLKLNATTGALQATFTVVPPGCTGGAVWGSPTIDQADGTLYVPTGNAGTCGVAEPYAEALVELRTADLSLVGAWRVPVSAQVPDSDFGSTPTLFTAPASSTIQRLVGIANKNGTYYAFMRNQVSVGPLWQSQIAVGSPEPSQGGSIAPSAWDGQHLYAAGGQTTINGVSCQGSVRALNPATGATIWNHCVNNGATGGAVLGAVTVVPGLVVVGAGNSLLVLAAATGQTLFSYQSGAPFWGAASISNGVLYQGDSHAHLYAFGL